MLKINSHKSIALVTMLLIPINLQPADPCTLKKMLGSHPDEICNTIKWLQKVTHDPLAKVIKLEPYQNRMLLYGPPGNGKSTYARQIAEETGREFLSFDASSIVIPYTGGGVQRISELIKNAEEIANEAGKGVVIFIDEIDALAANTELEHRTEHKLTLQKLWLELDLHEGDPNIFFIFATNNIDKIHPTFKNRFEGSKTIEITNPDAEKRLLLLKSILNKKDIPILNEKLISKEFLKIINAHYEDIKNQIDSIENLLKSCINNNSQKKLILKLALCAFQLNHIKLFLKKTYNDTAKSNQDMNKIYILFQTTLTNLIQVLAESKAYIDVCENNGNKKNFEILRDKIAKFPLQFIKCNIDLHAALLVYNEKNMLFQLDAKTKNEDEAKKINELLEHKTQLESQLDLTLNNQTKAAYNNYEKIIDLYLHQMNIGFKDPIITIDEPEVNLILDKTEGLCTRSYLRVITNLRNMFLQWNKESNLQSTFQRLDQLIAAEKIVDPKKDEEQKKADKEKEEETIRLLQIQDLVRRVSSNSNIMYAPGIHGGSKINNNQPELHRYANQVNYPELDVVSQANPLIKKAIALLKKNNPKE